MGDREELIKLIRSDEDRGLLPKGYTEWMRKELA